jgi:hypothetical protein
MNQHNHTKKDLKGKGKYRMEELKMQETHKREMKGRRVGTY